MKFRNECPNEMPYKLFTWHHSSEYATIWNETRDNRATTNAQNRKIQIDMWVRSAMVSVKPSLYINYDSIQRCILRAECTTTHRFLCTERKEMSLFSFCMILCWATPIARWILITCTWDQKTENPLAQSLLEAHHVQCSVLIVRHSSACLREQTGRIQKPVHFNA